MKKSPKCHDPERPQKKRGNKGKDKGKGEGFRPGGFLARAGLPMAILVCKTIVLLTLSNDSHRDVLECYPAHVDGVPPGYAVIDTGAPPDMQAKLATPSSPLSALKDHVPGVQHRPHGCQFCRSFSRRVRTRAPRGHRRNWTHATFQNDCRTRARPSCSRWTNRAPSAHTGSHTLTCRLHPAWHVRCPPGALQMLGAEGTAPSSTKGTVDVWMSTMAERHDNYDDRSRGVLCRQRRRQLDEGEEDLRHSTAAMWAAIRCDSRERASHNVATNDPSRTAPDNRYMGCFFPEGQQHDRTLAPEPQHRRKPLLPAGRPFGRRLPIGQMSSRRRYAVDVDVAFDANFANDLVHDVVGDVLHRAD